MHAMLAQMKYTELPWRFSAFLGCMVSPRVYLLSNVGSRALPGWSKAGAENASGTTYNEVCGGLYTKKCIGIIRNKHIYIATRRILAG